MSSHCPINDACVRGERGYWLLRSIVIARLATTDKNSAANDGANTLRQMRKIP